MYRMKLPLVFICIAGLLAAAGCKKKSDPPKSPTGEAKSDPRPTDPGEVKPRDADQTAPIQGRVGALAIPADFIFVRLNLKAARTTALYKEHEAKLKKMLTDAIAKDEKGAGKALVEICKLDPTSNVDEVSLGISADGGEKSEPIVLISGSFDSGKLMACMKPEMEKVGVTPKDVTVSGKTGMQFTSREGKETTVLLISANSFAMTAGANQAKLAAVLGGKSPSIEDTPLYKATAPQVNTDTLVTALVPKLPESMTSAAPIPVLKDIKALSALLGLPDDGLDLKLALHIGDNEKADQLAKSLPMLVGLLKSKLPELGEALSQALKVKAADGWVRVNLALDKATFGKLMKTLEGMLGGLFGGDRGKKDADDE